MLSKTSAFVVNALIELARLEKGRRAGAAAIARRINAPENYLSKLLKDLALRGVLDSRKGANGGFAFKKDPDKITLYDVVEPIDNVNVWSGCALGLKKCSDTRPCAVHHKWKHIKDVYADFLKSTTIAELV